MAMSFSFAVLENSQRNYILQVAGFDTGATTAGAQNGTINGIIAANGYVPSSSLKVRRIIYNLTSCTAWLQWHQTVNASLMLLSGYGTIDLRDTQGLINPKGAGSTGDIDLATYAISTNAAAALTAAMSLTLECIKGA